jgi:hypothetical protein
MITTAAPLNRLRVLLGVGYYLNSTVRNTADVSHTTSYYRTKWTLINICGALARPMILLHSSLLSLAYETECSACHNEQEASWTNSLLLSQV